MTPFQFARTPALRCGVGAFDELLSQISGRAPRSVALLTGKSSFASSSGRARLDDALSAVGTVHRFEVDGEPSVELVDSMTVSLRDKVPELVVAIGGGSVIDAAKALAAMVETPGSVIDYLEGVGTRKHDGRTLPLFAVPTTSGTGSEATSNAVISRIGEDGFKKSLRHINFVPQRAFVDPELTVSCPVSTTVASGLDAATQLLEAFVSTGASPVTDALSRTGLALVGRSFAKVARDGADLDARADMALAAWLSGVVLMNAGLGVVHGIASPVGGRFPIPHGVICGTLVASATRLIVERLAQEQRTAAASQVAVAALARYAEAGVLLSGEDTGSPDENRRMLIGTLEGWISSFGVRTLGSYGVRSHDVPSLAGSSGIKNTPCQLSASDICSIIETRL